MSKQEEKMMYKIVGQKEGITITASTTRDVTYDEARKIGVASVFGGVDKLIGMDPFVVLPITTVERWEDGAINFCPRCGANLKDHELERYDSFECFDCDSTIDVQILRTEQDD